jgi:APA family basic amino acid/polyamine antiporter
MAAPASGQLLRVLGLGFGLAAVVGGVIGQGILRTPGIVAANLPDPVWIMAAWALGGLFTLIDAFATVEVAASVPEAGGPYAFANRALGPLPGFLTGWADWLQNIVSSAFFSVVFAEFVHRLGLVPNVSTGVLAVGLNLAVLAINLTGTRGSGRAQEIGSAVKGAGLLALVIALFTLGGPGVAPPPAVSDAALTGGVGLLTAIAAARAIYGTYGGWNCATYFGEEVHQPAATVVRATFAGIGLVTGLYLLVNAALLHVLPIPVLAASKLPVADAARAVFGPLGDTVLTLFAMVAVATIANLQAMFNTRTLFAMARNPGPLPAAFTAVSPRGTPLAAMLATMVAIVLLASIGVYETLLSIYAPLATFVNIAVAVSALRLRRTEPDLPRPFRMPLYPLPALFAILVNLALTAAFFFEDFDHSRWSLLLFVLPLPFWFMARRRAPA